MGQYHSTLMMGYFPKLQAIGIYLGNVEVKECNNLAHKYTISKKDYEAEFFLFYDWLDDMYFFVNTLDMPEIKRKKSDINTEGKRAISTMQVNRIAYFATKSQDEFMNEMEAIIKDKSFLGWLIQPTNSDSGILSMDTISTNQIVVGETPTQVK